jgi:hypothetical protein
MPSSRFARRRTLREDAADGDQPPKPMLDVIFILSALVLLVSYDSAESRATARN